MADVVEVLWGLVALGVSGMTGYSIKTSGEAKDLAEKNSIEIDYLKKDMEAVKKLPVQMARLQTNMKQIRRSLSTIEAHLLRRQVIGSDHLRTDPDDDDDHDDEDDTDDGDQG